MNSLSKQQVHARCLEILQGRIAESQKAMEGFQNAANNETKSTAGDKHETSRAMMQADRDKVAVQLGNLLKMKLLLQKLNPSISLEHVGLGSFVNTDKGSFYLAIPLGNVNVEENEIIVISAASPVARAMMGKSKGEQFEMNGVRRIIKEVL